MVLARPMARSATPVPRVVRATVLGSAGTSYEVFDVVRYEAGKLVVRGPLLFEVGETLRIRLERDGDVNEVRARIAAHAGTGEDLVTEITILETQPLRRMISG